MSVLVEYTAFHLSQDLCFSGSDEDLISAHSGDQRKTCSVGTVKSVSRTLVSSAPVTAELNSR